MALITCKECGAEISSAAKACVKCGAPVPKAKRGGCGRLIVILLGIAVIVAAVNSVRNHGATNSSSGENSQSGTAPPALDETARNKNLEDCRETLKKDHVLGILYDMDWKSVEPRVVVGPTFASLPIDDKEAFALTVNCFLMAGDTDKLIGFDLLDWQTGKAVGHFSLGRYTTN